MEQTGIKQFDGTHWRDWKARMSFLLRDRNLIDNVTNKPTEEQLQNAIYMQQDRACQLEIVRHVYAAILEQITELPTAFIKFVGRRS